jgi:hypothetical protein
MGQSASCAGSPFRVLQSVHGPRIIESHTGHGRWNRGSRMGFIRTNWWILVAALALQLSWLYFENTLPPTGPILVELPIGPGGHIELPSHGGRDIPLIIGGWLFRPAGLVIMPIRIEWLAGIIFLVAQWITLVLVLTLGRLAFNAIHRRISPQ